MSQELLLKMLDRTALAVPVIEPDMLINCFLLPKCHCVLKVGQNFLFAALEISREASFC